MRRRVEALPALGEAIARALESGDDVALSTALAAREEALEEVAASEPDEAERRVLREVARADSGLIALAREAQRRLRTELVELAQLRAAVRAVPRSGPEMRFVSQRV
jgi:hypothetical protein